MDGYDDNLSPAEAARERRRDRDAEARARAGMKTGLAKQFKQVLDTQVKRARHSEGPAGADLDRTESAGERSQMPRRKP